MSNDAVKGWWGRTSGNGQATKIGCFGIILVLALVSLGFLSHGTKQQTRSVLPQKVVVVEQPAQANPSTENDDLTANAALNEADDAKVAGEMNIKAMIKDADSAEFRNEFVSRLSGGNLMLCGEVNSKNGFGALTGYKRFIASPNPDAPSIIEGEQLEGKAFRQARDFACSNSVGSF